MVQGASWGVAASQTPRLVLGDVPPSDPAERDSDDANGSANLGMSAGYHRQGYCAVREDTRVHPGMPEHSRVPLGILGRNKKDITHKKS